MPSSGLLGGFSQGSFAACGRRPSFSMAKKKAKRPRGRLRMSASLSYLPFPGPHYGGYPFKWAKISGVQNLSDWSESPPGHWALSLQKLPPARFHSRAWLCRANAPGPNPGGRMLCAPTGFRWTVGAAISRPQAFPLQGGRGHGKAVTDEGDLLACPRREAQGPPLPNPKRVS